MDATLYIKILFHLLNLFILIVIVSWLIMIQNTHPMQPKSKKITWWHTPVVSSDCNPFETLWHELKEYIRRVIKPTTKQELKGLYDVSKSYNILCYMKLCFP